MKLTTVFILGVCLVFASAFTKNSDFNLQSRIVGGGDAKDGQIPYQVSLRLPAADLHFCGGAIISERFILTAAHCMADLESRPSFVVAVIGSIRANAGSKVKIDKIISHRDWDRRKQINDISLLRTVEDIVFSDNVQPIALPIRDLPEEGNTKAIVSGWGKNSINNPSQRPHILQFIETNTISLNDCAKRYERLKYDHLIHKDVLCTINEQWVGACNGDSGGPLVDVSDPNNKSLVGIVSWSIPCGMGYPDVFTRVYSYIEWIDENMTE